MKFTQEIKDKWLEALKSGEYKQGFKTLRTERGEEIRYCCLGVLGEIHPDLNSDPITSLEKSPYEYIRQAIGIDPGRIWRQNDKDKYSEDYPCDYSNVIPIIEELEVTE